MDTEKFETFIREKEEKNPDQIYLGQLILAKHFCTMEQLEFLADQTDPRQQLLFLVLMRYDCPFSYLKELGGLSQEQIREKLTERLYLLDGIGEKQEKIELQIEHLKLMVKNTEQMEKYLHVIVKQKDRMLEEYDKEIRSLREQLEAIQKTEYPEKKQPEPGTGTESREMESQIEPKSAIEAETEPQNVAEITAKMKQESQKEQKGAFEQIKNPSLFSRFRQKKKQEASYQFLAYLREAQWTEEQMDFLLQCHKEGMTEEDIFQISDPGFTVERMQLLKKVLRSMG